MRALPDLLPGTNHAAAGDVDRELANLPSGQRHTFQLFAFEGKSYDEIARRQGVATATVGTRILRARIRLKQLLEARACARSG